jgi:hypothetical protein
MKDVIGSADMTSQVNLTSFTKDRFGNVVSALALNGGWTQVPQGVYFNSLEFSISVWVYPSNVGYFSRIIDFGNGQLSDNVVLSLSGGYTLQPFFEIYSGPSKEISALSSKQITQNQWQFLTATFNGSMARIYLNGTLIGESVIQSHIRPFNLSRSKCYIGKSNWLSNGDGYSSSYLDDLRFYNKSLTQVEILELMNYNKNETSLCFYNLLIVL